MNVLDKCSNLISFQLKEKLGDGADGEVFQLEDSEKVIKLSILYDLDYNTDLIQKFKNISKNISTIQKNKLKHFAAIYEYGLVCRSSRKTFLGEQKFIIYYYVMEKLFKLTIDERKVFHTILSHEDLNLEKKFSSHQLDSILNGLSFGLDFDFTKVRNFYFQTIENSIQHNDLHVRNIMKDKFGCFKLIDFDRITITD